MASLFPIHGRAGIDRQVIDLSALMEISLRWIDRRCEGGPTGVRGCCYIYLWVTHFCGEIKRVFSFLHSMNMITRGNCNLLKVGYSDVYFCS